MSASLQLPGDELEQRICTLGQLAIQLLEEHRFQEAAAVMMNRGNALVGWLSAESRDRTEAVFQKIKDQTNQIVALATEHHAEVSKAVFALLDASPALKAYAKSRCMSSTHWKDEEDRR